MKRFSRTFSQQLSSVSTMCLLGLFTLTPLCSSADKVITSGPTNSIVDVPGIQISHVTLIADTPTHIRTGVTAIVPNIELLSHKQGNIATHGLYAYGAVLSGNGELTGLHNLNQKGILNSPIVLTNTRSVGIAYEGVYQFFQKHYPQQWQGELPVIAECWDGFFNNSDYLSLTPLDVQEVIEKAINTKNTNTPVEQGRVGAGTGMRSFGLHAGIGTSSRKIVLSNKTYTLGVLVNTNHSKFENMSPWLKQTLTKTLGNLDALHQADHHDQFKSTVKLPRQGSIIVVIATDLPLLPHQLKQLTEHAGLGIGKTGSMMATHSGDFALAFSTAQVIPLSPSAPSLTQVIALQEQQLNLVFQAVIDSVAEAQINAILAAHVQSKNESSLPHE